MLRSPAVVNRDASRVVETACEPARRNCSGRPRAEPSSRCPGRSRQHSLPAPATAYPHRSPTGWTAPASWRISKLGQGELGFCTRLNANERFNPRIGRCCAGRWRRRAREEVKELHDSINPAGLIAAVNRLTVSSWIGIIGSAAYAARDFQADSDIDLIVLHPNESRFIWDTFHGRDLEIHLCAHQRLTNIAKHPEWFGVDWAWQIGKIVAAEHLDGVRPVLPLPGGARNRDARRTGQGTRPTQKAPARTCAAATRGPRPNGAASPRRRRLSAQVPGRCGADRCRLHRPCEAGNRRSAVIEVSRHRLLPGASSWGRICHRAVGPKS